MRIPPYYESPKWQRFFAGVFIGAILGWLVFLFLYGELQEKQLKRIAEQQSKINELESTIKVWEEDYQNLNEQNKKQLKIQAIEISFTNDEKLKIDSFTKLGLKNDAQAQLKHLINNNIEAVAENKNLLLQTIENKTYVVDDQKYQLKVKQLYLFTTIELHLEIKLVN